MIVIVCLGVACIAWRDRDSGTIDMHFEVDDAWRKLIRSENVGEMAGRLRPTA